MKQPSQRVLDLLAKMTLEEKANQLSCVLPAMATVKGVFSREKAEAVMPNGIGRFTQYATPFLKGAKQAAEAHNELQKYIIEKCGVPVIIQNESSTGLVATGATIFPIPLSLASTMDPILANRMGQVLTKEGRAIGAKVMMSPVADVARDSRWGRVGETFGEDPMVCARFSAEEAKGIQGDDYTKNCAALAKHWVAYGVSEGGVNCATINIGKKEVFEVYVTPFAAAIKEADMQGAMVTYSDIDGRPMSVNDEWTRKVLRDDLGFNGALVCDGMSIPRVIETQGIFKDREELAAAALKAGVDADTMFTTVYNHIPDGVRNGVIDEKDLDDCVLRILQQKEEFGLLDDPYVDPEKAEEAFHDPASEELSKEIAEKSITLLKNSGVLPLKKDTKKIALIGPFAQRMSYMFGAYAYPCMISGFLGSILDSSKNKMEGFSDMVSQMFDVESLKEKLYRDPSLDYQDNLNLWLKEDYGMKTLDEAMREEFAQSEIVTHFGPHNNSENWKEEIEEATKVAKDSDVILLTLGEITGFGPDATSGEGTNNPDLTLPGYQNELLRACAKLGKPVVLVLFNGRPLILKEANELCDAIVEAWYPGVYAGEAVSKVLSGANNPGGTLPVSFPQISSQCPLYYGHLTGSGYTNIKQKPDPTVLQPLYPFGYGLSYTSFRMGGLSADSEVETGKSFTVSCEVENTGERKGDVTVQIYTHSKCPTIIRPIKELRAFKRVSLKAGEKKTVTFTLDTRNFGYFNWKNEFVIEARPQEIFLCSDSSTIVEKTEISFTGKDKEILHDRVYDFGCEVK
ncbi:MAG: glycoside hydrolase family 3 C-terminal domain-containing protein [Erysipelotrichaceae bacterium]|nr:glycoside hydrolase family 3 C-terminal domain-containing protein [Erysipelotrichaceae bacterium]